MCVVWLLLFFFLPRQIGGLHIPYTPRHSLVNGGLWVYWKVREHFLPQNLHVFFTNTLEFLLHSFQPFLFLEFLFFFFYFTKNKTKKNGEKTNKHFSFSLSRPSLSLLLLLSRSLSLSHCCFLFFFFFEKP